MVLIPGLIIALHELFVVLSGITPVEDSIYTNQVEMVLRTINEILVLRLIHSTPIAHRQLMYIMVLVSLAEVLMLALEMHLHPCSNHNEV